MTGTYRPNIALQILRSASRAAFPIPAPPTPPRTETERSEGRARWQAVCEDAAQQREQGRVPDAVPLIIHEGTMDAVFTGVDIAAIRGDETVQRLEVIPESTPEAKRANAMEKKLTDLGYECVRTRRRIRSSMVEIVRVTEPGASALVGQFAFERGKDRFAIKDGNSWVRSWGTVRAAAKRLTLQAAEM